MGVAQRKSLKQTEVLVLDLLRAVATEAVVRLNWPLNKLVREVDREYCAAVKRMALARALAPKKGGS